MSTYQIYCPNCLAKEIIDMCNFESEHQKILNFIKQHICIMETPVIITEVEDQKENQSE